MSRQRRRSMLRALRKLGCTCTPELDAVDPAAYPPGALDGAVVQHGPNCPLGDRMAALNRRGIIPVLTFKGRPGCQR